MPELPEVQTVVNDLNAANLIGLPIIAARVYWPRIIAEPSPKLFCRQIKGQKITAIRRRGKYLVFEIADGNTLLLHLRMSGRLHLVSISTPRTNMSTSFSASMTAGNCVFTIRVNSAVYTC